MVATVRAAEGRGDWTGAAASAERALEEAKKQGQESTAITAEVFDSLGDATRKLHESQRAASAYAQSLRIKEIVFGSDSVEVAKGALLLGRVELEDCHLESARALLERATTLSERHLPVADTTLSQAALALGDLFERTGDEARAESYLQRAVTLLEEREPEWHTDLVPSLLALAGLHQRTSKHAEEARTLEHVLAIAKLPQDAQWVLVATERLTPLTDGETMARYLEKFHVVTWTGGDANYTVAKPTPPKPFTHCAQGPRGSGQISNVEKVVSGLKRPFRACFNAELAAHPALEATLRYSSRIGADGAVRRVDGRGLDVPASLVECAGRAIFSAQFAPPEGGGATLEIPLTFRLARE
jgi:hypothetical protein